MRSKLLIILIGLLGLFSAAIVFRVDQLLFADKINWSEAQARAQLGTVAEALSSELRTAREGLESARLQLTPGKDYKKGPGLSRFQMIGSVVKSGKEWSFESSSFLEGTSVRNWATQYSALSLKKVDDSKIPSNGVAVVSLYDPLRKPYLLILARSSSGWLVGLTGAELFQGLMDRQKGQISDFSVVNSLGQTLGHSTAQYVGTFATDDPLVAEMMRNRGMAGSGNFQTPRGTLQGFYEQISQTNVYAIATTQLSEVMLGRRDVRWQLILMGFGFILIGSALIVLWVKEPAPTTIPAPAPASPVEIPETTKVRMDAFTQSASSIAHELRAPVLGLLGRIRLLKEKAKDQELAKELARIEEGAREANLTLNKLMTFAGEKEELLVPTSIAEVLSRSVQIFDAELKLRGIEIQKNFEQITLIKAQPLLLGKAFEEIIKNSIQAMDRVLVKKIVLTIQSNEVGPLVFLEDTGEGVSTENLEKICDPFFTTKSSDKHPGLGLSLAMGIFRGSGGKMKVESVQGKGTKVMIQFEVAVNQTITAQSLAEPPPVVEPSLPIPPPPPSFQRPDSDSLLNFELPQVLNDQLMEKTFKLIDQLDENLEGPPQAPPPPSFEADSAASPEPVVIAEPKEEVKIDKPQFSLKKKVSKVLDIQVEVRRPRGRS